VEQAGKTNTFGDSGKQEAQEHNEGSPGIYTRKDEQELHNETLPLRTPQVR
jgi:hypothetical protein